MTKPVRRFHGWQRILAGIFVLGVVGFSATWLLRSPPAYDSKAQLYTGDFETGDFNQWETCQNRIVNTSCKNYNGSSYVLRKSTDIKRQGKYAARFELRDGDVPDFGGGERTEVSGDTSSGGRAGQDLWYQWSTLFDTSFQDDFASQGWGLTDQWHDESSASPPLGLYLDVADGYWGLRVNKQSKPGSFIATPVVWRASLNKGEWQDLKLHIKWSTDPKIGFIELWHNGKPQVLESSDCGGQTRCHIQTMTPGGGDEVYFKQGIYRDPAVQGTSIIYKDGYVVARSEAGLGAPDKN